MNRDDRKPTSSLCKQNSRKGSLGELIPLITKPEKKDKFIKNGSHQRRISLNSSPVFLIMQESRCAPNGLTHETTSQPQSGLPSSNP